MSVVRDDSRSSGPTNDMSGAPVGSARCRRLVRYRWDLLSTRARTACGLGDVVAETDEEQGAGCGVVGFGEQPAERALLVMSRGIGSLRERPTGPPPPA